MRGFYMDTIISILQQNITDVKILDNQLKDPVVVKNNRLEAEVNSLHAHLETLLIKIMSHRNELERFDNLKKLLSNTINNVQDIFNTIHINQSNDFSKLDLTKQIAYINSAIDLIDNFRHSQPYIDNIIKLAIDQKIEVAEQKLAKFDSLTNKLQGIATEKIYETAQTKYETRYKELENWGYKLIGLSIISTLIFLEIYHYNKELLYSLITLKVTIILVAIFLITYFFKQATHYRKLADIAEQRHLELEALPSFMSTISDSAQDEIRKELALKYFGQSLDEKHYSTTESLIQDQIKSSTEVLKMTTSLLKSERLSINTTSDHDSNPKPN